MSRLIPAALAWLLCAGFSLPPAAAALDLPAKFTRALKFHKVPHNAVSLVVQAVDEDTPRLALNVEVARNPASTIKLVTTWTALDILGPTYTWPTRIYALGPIENGVLKGDLLIKGFGDPYLVIEDFWKMLGELRRKGVRDIEGDLVLDDSLFEVDENDPAAFDGERYRLYNVLPSALIVNFKAIDFMIDPDPANGVVNITTIPQLANLQITNRIKMTSARCRGKSPRIIMDTAAPDRPDHVIFSGEIPGSCRNYQLGRTAMTPNSYTFGLFQSLWQQWGGTLSGGFRRASLPNKQRALLTWRSRHLAEVIRPLNKWSNNLMTRMLLYSIGEAQYPPPITRANGTQALRDHLAGRGLDVTKLVIDNGAGLSRDTRVTAQFLTDLLRLAWFESTMPEFVASLAIAGKDGTVRKRFRGTPQSAHMHLKTGSLDDVSAIGGYVHTPHGRTFMVSLLVNSRGVNYGIGKDLQDALLAWTFAQH